MRKVLGSFLALWSIGFACVHVAWALGWRGGLDPDFAPISERPWFLAYDLAAGVLMFVAGVIAWLLGRGGLPHRLRTRLVTLTLIGSAVALARGVPALMWDAAAGETGLVSLGADVWFTVAGLCGVGLALVVRAQTASRSKNKKPMNRAPGSSPDGSTSAGVSGSASGS